MMKTITLISLFCAILLPIQIHGNPPPEQFEAIAELVEAGKHREALGQVRAFLTIWPENSDLRALERMLVEAVEAPRPTPAPTPREAPRPSLSTADRLEIQTTVTGVRNALNLREQEARGRALEEVLNRPIPANANSSPWLPYWQARAIAALQLGDYREGWRAGKELVELGALEGSDRALNEVVVEVNARGWLRDSPEAIRRAAEERYRPWLGQWRWRRSGTKDLGGGSMENFNQVFSVTIRLNAKLEIETTLYLGEKARTRSNSIENQVEIPGNNVWRIDNGLWHSTVAYSVSNVRIHERPQRIEFSVVQTLLLHENKKSEHQIQLSLGEGGNRMNIRINPILDTIELPPTFEAVRIQ